jgi:putative heme iron utilization protein
MRTSSLAALSVALGIAGSGPTALAESLCATPEQAQRIQAFYRENPSTMPVIAARRLALPEALVTSGLPPEQVAGTAGAAFSDVWAAMTRWTQAQFLIMKGENVFEVLSPIAPATPSKTSKYTNLAYEHPLRGHLRPDLYASVYAITMPGRKDKATRGVLFYDPSGESVFGVFMSGESMPEPAAEDVANFDALMKDLRNRSPVCPAG